MFTKRKQENQRCFLLLVIFLPLFVQGQNPSEAAASEPKTILMDSIAQSKLEFIFRVPFGEKALDQVEKVAEVLKLYGYQTATYMDPNMETMAVEAAGLTATNEHGESVDCSVRSGTVLIVYRRWGGALECAIKTLD
jgi:hypothetical protein